MDAKAYDQLLELLKDAEACPRLNSWEESFLDDMRERAGRYGSDVLVSDKQQQVLSRIESKVYAT